MSEFMSALVISGSIFAVMMASQLGRREYSWHKIAIPIVSVGVFGWAYLRHLPTVGNAIWLYLAGIAIGGIFAVLTTMTTTVEQDPATKKLFTRTGVAFVITWLVAVALRIGFVWGVDNDASFREQVGRFMMNHDLVQDSIAPFFVLMALTTVLGRVVALKIRSNRLTKADTSNRPLANATA
jgi:hypothetical protein